MTDELPSKIELPVATYGDAMPRSFADWPRHTADAVRMQLKAFNARLEANGVSDCRYDIVDATETGRAGKQQFSYVTARKVRV